jgi:hypothetical protein
MSHATPRPGVGECADRHADHDDHKREGAHEASHRPRHPNSAVDERHHDLGHHDDDNGEQRPATQNVTLRRSQRIVGGGREHGLQATHMEERQSHRARRKRQREQATQPSVGQRKIQRQAQGKRYVAAARVGEEEREHEHRQTRRSGGPEHHRVLALPRRRKCHGDTHDHHQGEYVPVAERPVEAREGVRMGHHIRQRLAQEGVHGDGRRHDEIAVADHAQMNTPGSDHDRGRRSQHVQGSVVEGYPGQVGPDGPDHREPLPHGEHDEGRQAEHVQLGHRE